MRNVMGICISAFLLLFFIQTSLYASAKPIKEGDPFPKIILPIPKDPAYQKYLGLSGTGTFQIKDIKAEVVLIQIFHSG